MKTNKFYRYLLRYWKEEALVLLLSAAGVGISLVNPYLTKLIIDKAYGNKDAALFVILIAIGGIVFVSSGIVTGLSSYINRYIRLRVGFDLNRGVFKKLQSLPYSFFQDNSTGKNLFRASYDVDQAGRFISDTLPQGISLVPRSILIFVIVLYLDWKMASLALALTPFLYVAPYYFIDRLKKVFKEWVENSQDLFTRVQEVLSRMQLVKAFGKENEERKAHTKNLVKNIRYSLKNSRLETASLFANSVVNKIVLGLIIFYGGWQVIKGRMTLGALSAIAIYLNQLAGLQNSFAQYFQQISMGRISCERLANILDADPYLAENAGAQDIVLPGGRIEFRNVTFGYTKDKDVLNNVSFCIEGGSHAAFSGPSGSGKTTIINLILRLYGLKKGDILIDGHNIKNIRAKSLYAQIGVVLQEPYLWNDTIENNIRYAKKTASAKEITESARIACIDDFIDAMPQKYNTIIGENACKISEGQKQRIAIARAIIKKPRILILDEALSSVEPEIEERIINNIKDALKESTIIIISHRPSAIKKMDVVYHISTPDKIIRAPVA